MTSFPASRGALGVLTGAAAFALITAASAPARAHFSLEEPACWMSQDSQGAPEKAPPCGNEGGGTPTNKITAYAKGDTVTITIDEKIFHPGHYRVSLSVNDRSELPPEPKVKATPDTPCGTAAVQDPPVFPVLADNLLVHTHPFTGPQTIHVKLPSNVTCDHCTLQVLEFMSNHPLNNPGGCFYHHCADIKIHEVDVDGGTSGTGGSGGSGEGGSPTTTTTEEGGSTSSPSSSSDGGGGASNSGSAESSGGCGCATPGSGASGLAGLAGFSLVFAFARRRRRRR